MISRIAAWGGLFTVITVASFADASNKPPAHCPVPSVDACKTEFAAKPMDHCKNVNDSACSQILSDDFTAHWQSDQTQLCIPTNFGQICQSSGLVSSIQPKGMQHAGVLLDAAYEPFDDTRLQSIAGVSSQMSYANLVQREQLPSRYGQFDTRDRHPDTTKQQPAFEAHGAGIQSCAEYVYKKNYDFSRFEEVAATCKTDYLCLGELVAMTGVDQPGLDKPTLLSKDSAGTPMNSQLRPQDGSILLATPHPKNGFFVENPTIFLGRIAKTHGSAIAGEMNADVTASYASPYIYGDRLSWHMEQRAAQAPLGMTLAEYRDIELRVVAYQAKVARYDAVRDAIGADVNMLIYPEQYDACGNVRKPEIPSTCNKKGNYVPPKTSRNLAFYKAMDDVADLLVAEWNHKAVFDGVTADHGCLASAGIRCDWSPKLLTEYQRLFQKEREKDFDACLRLTGDDFTGNYPPYNADLAAGRLDARVDWRALEKWEAYAGPAREALTKDLPFLAKDKVGNAHHGGDQYGSKDTFWGEYAYDVGWSADVVRTPAPNAHLCNLHGEAHASLSAHGTAINTDFSVVDAYAQVTAGYDAAADLDTTRHLYLFGSRIFDSGPSPAHTPFHHVADPETAPLAGGSTLIFVGPFPVTLSASISAEFGMTGDITVTAPRPTAACSAYHASSPAPLFSVAASFEPYAAVTGKASAAIGGELFNIGAEAGIEGTIDIIRTSLPFHATAAIGTFPFPDGPAVALDMNTDVSFDLSFMGGDIHAFVEVCYLVDCKRVEKSILSWKGLTLDHTALWQPLHKQYPLLAIDSAVPPSTLPKL